MITLPGEKSGQEQCYQKVLKMGFTENKGQSGPLPVVSKTQGKCQSSVDSVRF